jgi:hypothetical protein
MNRGSSCNRVRSTTRFGGLTYSMAELGMRSKRGCSPPCRHEPIQRGGDFRNWHVADLGQCLTLVRDALNSGHIGEAAKPTLMTRSGPSQRFTGNSPITHSSGSPAFRKPSSWIGVLGECAVCHLIVSCGLSRCASAKAILALAPSPRSASAAAKNAYGR